MKRGFTLIELIASLIILSIVALIVTPNIYSSIKNYREQLYATQIKSLETAAKNWVADNVDTAISLEENNYRTYVFIDDLQAGGYIDQDLKNPNTGKKFNNLTFVIIETIIIEANEFNSENYKYKYTVIDTTDKYIKYLAQCWLKDNSSSLDYNSITTTEEKLLTTVTKENMLIKENDEYKYAYSSIIESITSSIKDIETGTLITNFSAEIYAIKTDEGYSYTYRSITG
ncbi:MAG: type II secretion system protein [Bacilli bacterium]|nr:type II secretion system protein [Bacilli bacterium]